MEPNKPVEAIGRPKTNVEEARSKLFALEEATKELESATDGQEFTFHHFAPGVYVREFFLPKGMYFTSKIHKTTHIFIVASGVTIISDGNEQKKVVGPTVMVTKPGTKRAVFGVEDTTFFTVHVTDETDLDVIENNLIAKSFDEIDQIERSDKELIK
jgi:quercetin dioxygenase-like cupin family protein